jgi:UDP-3-O-[3-hydroxymyristoyl] glucosamine N-acyltransferase
MATPIITEIYVNQSTTLVQIDTTQVPDVINKYVVRLSSLNTPGSLITIRDIIGNASADNPITISTTKDIKFLDGGGVNNNIYKITQPYGFLTVTPKNSMTWGVLNTFGFPDASAAANINNLTASSITINNSYLSNAIISTALISTLSTDNVFIRENLSVGQSTIAHAGFYTCTLRSLHDMITGGTLYAASTVSSIFGNITSTLTVPYISTQNIEIYGVLRSASTISTMGPLFVGKGISTTGDLAVGGSTFVQGELRVLQNVLFMSSLSTLYTLGVGRETQLFSSLMVKDNIFANAHISTMSNVNVGGALSVMKSAFFIGHVCTQSNLNVGGALSVMSTLYTYGDVVLNSSLYVKSEVSTLSNVYIASSLSVGKDLSVYGRVYFNDQLNLKNLSVHQDLFVNNTISTYSSIVAGQFLRIMGSTFLIGPLSTVTDASIGGGLSTMKDLAVRGTGYFASNVVVQSSLSTMGNFMVAGFMSTLSSVNIGQNLTIQSNLLTGTLSTIGPGVFYSSMQIQGGLSVFSSVAVSCNLDVGGTLTAARLLLNGSTIISTLAVTNTIGFGLNLSTSTLHHGLFSTQGAMDIGGRISTTNVLVVGSTIDSQFITVRKNLSTIGDVGIGSNLFVLSNIQSGASTIVNGGFYGNNEALFANSVRMRNLLVDEGAIINGAATISQTALVQNTLTVTGGLLVSDPAQQQGQNRILNDTYLVSAKTSSMIVYAFQSTFGQAAFYSSVQIQGGLSVFSSLAIACNADVGALLTASSIATRSLQVSTLSIVQSSNFVLNISSSTLHSGLFSTSGEIFSGRLISTTSSLAVGDDVNFFKKLTVGGDTVVNQMFKVGGETTLSNALKVGLATTLSNTLNVGQATTLSRTLNVGETTKLTGNVGIGADPDLINALSVTGKTSLVGTLGVSDDTTLSKKLTVVQTTKLTGNVGIGADPNTNALYVTGNTAILGPLGVTGNTTLTGTLGVTEATTLSRTLNVGETTRLSGNVGIGAAPNANALSVTGNTTLTGTLGVTGNTTLTGTLGVTEATTLSRTLNVGETTRLSGNVGIGAAPNANALSVTGNTTLTGTLGVTGNTTLTGTLGVTGNTTLTGTLGVTEATTLSRTLNVGEGTTLTGNVGIGASSNATNKLYVNGNTAILGPLGVTGNTTLAGTLGVTGNTTLTGTVGVTGNTTLTGTLGVSQTTTLSQTLNVLQGTTHTGNVGIGASSNATNALFVTGTTQFNGNVGVKADANSYALNVAGDINYTGNLRLNGTPVNFTPGVNTLGNIGINRPTNPDYSLDVSGNTRTTGNVSTIGNTITVGNVSTVGNTATVGNTVTIGNFSTIGNVYIQGNVSTVGNTVTIGNVSTVGNTATVGNTVTIGNVSTVGNVSIKGGVSTIGNTITIGNVSTVGNTATLGNTVTIGNVSTIGNTVIIGNVSTVGSTITIGPTTLLGHMAVGTSPATIPGSVVTTFAGANTVGNTNGTGTAAQFQEISAVCSDTLGRLYIYEKITVSTRDIKLITNGVVTTILDSSSNPISIVSATFGIPCMSVFYDGTAGSICYTKPTSVSLSDTIYRRTTSDGLTYGAETSYITITGTNMTAVVQTKNIAIIYYVNGYAIYKYDGISSTLIAGSQATLGYVDASGTAARFATIYAMCLDPTETSLYVSEHGNNSIRKVSLTSPYTVTTYAGSTVGFADGFRTSALFYAPVGIACDSNNNLYVSDSGNNRIRFIDGVTGLVTTATGTGTAGSVDGTGSAATIASPRGLTLSTDGYIYVGTFGGADTKIRRMSPFYPNIVSVNGTLNVNTKPDFNYALDVAGNSRLAGNTLYVGAYSTNTTHNLIRFSGTNTDGGVGETTGFLYGTTVIGERIWSGVKSSELILFKGNDNLGGDLDRVRVLASGGFQVDIASSATWSNGYEPPAASVTGALCVIESGNVGIGTTTPAYKLDVNGDIRTSGSFIGTVTEARSLRDPGGTERITCPNSSKVTLRSQAPTNETAFDFTQLTTSICSIDTTGRVSILSTLTVGPIGNSAWRASDSGEIRCFSGGNALSLKYGSIKSYDYDNGFIRDLSITAAQVNLSGGLNINATAIPFRLGASGSINGNTTAYGTTPTIQIQAGSDGFNGNSGVYVSGTNLSIAGQSLYWGTTLVPAASIMLESGRSILGATNTDNNIRFNTRGVERCCISGNGGYTENSVFYDNSARIILPADYSKSYITSGNPESLILGHNIYFYGRTDPVTGTLGNTAGKASYIRLMQNNIKIQTCDNNGNFGPSYNTKSCIYIKGNDGVGIGTETPECPLHVQTTTNISFTSFITNSAFGFNGQFTPATNPDTVAIKANGVIWTTRHFIAQSDKRIKKNIKPVVDSLDIVNKLNVVSFDYIDVMKAPVKHGLIAQELQKVYPEAVSIARDYIPSVYSLGTYAKADKTDNVTITSSIPHVFVVKDKIKLYINQDGKVDTRDFEYNTEILEVLSETEFIVKPWENFVLGQDLFIYGKEVNDFLGVDKPLIGLIAAGACKILSEKVTALQATVDVQTAEIASLKATVAAILQRYPV